MQYSLEYVYAARWKEYVAVTHALAANVFLVFFFPVDLGNQYK